MYRVTFIDEEQEFITKEFNNLQEANELMIYASDRNYLPELEEICD